MGRKDIHVYLKPEAYHVLRNLAFSTGRSYSEVVEGLLLRALINPVEKCPSTGELLQVIRKYLDSLTENLIRRNYEADACSAIKDPEHRKFCSLIDIVFRGYLHELGKLFRKKVITSKDLIALWESKPSKKGSEAGSSIDALLKEALEHAKQPSKAKASDESEKPAAEKPKKSRLYEIIARARLEKSDSELNREDKLSAKQSKTAENQGSKPEPKPEARSESEPDLLDILRKWRKYGSEQ